MAKRYGGEHSPKGHAPRYEGKDDDGPAKAIPTARPYQGAKRTKAGGRVNVLFFIPLFLAFISFTREPAAMVTGLIAVGLMFLAAWLTREGLLAEEAYNARKVAKRPAMPRKIFGSVLIGAGIGLAATVSVGGIALSALLGLIGAGLHSLAFGIDPLKDKGAEGIDSFQTERVARAVDEAEKHLAAMKDAILRAEDRSLEARVDGFAQTAREMFRTIEDDPRDLTAARKYLSVYLMGAKDATVKFADIYARNRSAEARADYESLLDDLQTSFAERNRTMLLDDKSDLDIEIGVLRDRLAREGVKPE